MNISIEPFLILDDYLITCFILTNYSLFGLATLIEIVRLITTKKNITLHQLELFNKRIIACPELYATKFFENNNLRQEIDVLLEKENVIHFNSPANECIFCNARLSNKTKDYQAMVYYDSSKPKKAVINSKICDICNASHFISYAENSQKERKPLETILNSKFIAFTNETIFDRIILERLTAGLLCDHATFMGYVSSHNHLFDCEKDYLENKETVKRSCLNEKRLIEAWFFYQFLKVKNEITDNKVQCEFPTIEQLDSVILQLKPSLLPFFIKKWSGNYKFYFLEWLFFFENYIWLNLVMFLGWRPIITYIFLIKRILFSKGLNAV